MAIKPLVQAFFNHTLDLAKINHASIILIPKIAEALTIQQHRPVSLINCSFKIISKIIANRLVAVLDSLIDTSQRAFIKGRSIFDNIVYAQNILFQVRKTKTKGILFKIDFEKTFDKVNWNFLIEVLKARGFGDKWIQWIKEILESGQTFLNINGQLSPYFKCKKGLRQGDPLSPFLFNLVADALSRILQKTMNAGYLLGLGDFIIKIYLI